LRPPRVTLRRTWSRSTWRTSPQRSTATTMPNACWWTMPRSRTPALHWHWRSVRSSATDLASWASVARNRC